MWPLPMPSHLQQLVNHDLLDLIRSEIDQANTLIHGLAGVPESAASGVSSPYKSIASQSVVILGTGSYA